jgi:hypothetical protein
MRVESAIDSEIREDVDVPSADSSFDNERASIADLDGQESQVSDGSLERMSRNDEIDCVRERCDAESMGSGHAFGDMSAIIPAPESPVESIDDMTDLDEVHDSQIRPHEVTTYCLSLTMSQGQV